MANRNKWWISPETLVGIANAIRSKKGTTDLIPVTELEAEIMSIVGDGGSWCGEYVDGTNYKSGAIVSFEGNIYLCIKDLDDQQDPTNTEYWKMLNKLPNLISKTITENGTYKINEKSALGIWRLNSDFKITSVIDVREEIEGTFVAVAEDGTIQELPLRRFRLNTFDNNTYGTLALKSSRHGFPFSNTTIFDHKQTIRLETYDASAGLLYDQQDIPLDSELGEQLRYFTITNVGVMQIGTEEALTEWLYANCTKIAKIDGYSEVIVNVPSEAPNLCGTEVTPTKDIQNIVPEGDFDGFDEVIVNPIPDEYIIPNLQEKTATKNGEVTADEGYTGLSKVTVDLPLLSKTITKNGTYKARNESADELQGIWVFKEDNITIPVSSNSPITYNVNFTTLDGRYTHNCIRLVNTGEPYYVALAYELHFCGGDTDTIVYKARYSDSNGLWLSYQNRTITITSTLEEVTNGSALLAWLQANATKMPIEGYSEVIVNVEGTGSALPVEVATEAEMTELLTSGEVGGVYKYTGETTDTYENGALYVLEEEEAYFTIVQLGTETTYPFERSMTWADWCESDYGNNTSYFIMETNVYYIGSGNIVSYSDKTPVKPTDPINSNEKYTIVNNGGSND